MRIFCGGRFRRLKGFFYFWWFFVQVEYVGLRDDYVDAHIENAAFVDWTRDIVDEHSGDLYNIKGRDEFIQVMEEKGWLRGVDSGGYQLLWTEKIQKESVWWQAVS